ncbi:50S ribosomal protein L6 [Anaeropeptidivorans aminofermentans]|jgi:large subunit ribosomal protein L6|uniref:50S ribosomal protein L6 n=1 Tax=Anaeropeptidivorans aminofermentans TaxID=2934315 RepID=UPI002023F546|nr:50S ribosomal protein L6 [Anaeropeptidivorans aminofermentans]MBE6012223.1 50S ribosomal protein L6 [Lachnospiraceae bacterium]
MSRIGRMPVAIPAGVDVKLEAGNLLTVKGPKGTLQRKLVDDMNIAIEDGHIVVTRPSELKKHKALHGLTRALIFNMVEGVTNGYVKNLEIQGVGYRAAKAGNKLTLTLGYSHPVEMTDPEGVTSTVEGTNKITVSGIDKEKVGQYAAEIRSKRAPEPYKGKGIRYAGEKVRRKVGKTGKK